MKAQVGDELVVKGRHVGDHDRTGVIIEVRGEAGGPPYLVRWSDGHESSFFPGIRDHGGAHLAARQGPPSDTVVGSWREKPPCREAALGGNDRGIAVQVRHPAAWPDAGARRGVRQPGANPGSG